MDKQIILYGDGIHDDTDALQSLLDGNDVFFPDGVKVERLRDGEFVKLPPGIYRTDAERPLRMPGSAGFSISLIGQTAFIPIDAPAPSEDFPFPRAR